MVFDTAAFYRHSMGETPKELLSNPLLQELEDLARPHFDSFSDITTEVRGKVNNQLVQRRDQLGGNALYGKDNMTTKLSQLLSEVRSLC